MSKQKIYNHVISLSGAASKLRKKDLIAQLKLIAESAENELDKISENNRKIYLEDIEASRLKRKINNSRQAIKRAWNNRKIKKDLIFKHVKILRGLK